MTTLEQRSSRLRQVPNRFQIRRTILEHLATRLIAEFERGAGWLFPSYWGEFTDFQKEIYNSHLEDAVELASKYLRYREKQRRKEP
jgi:hypothetical protein